MLQQFDLVLVHPGSDPTAASRVLLETCLSEDAYATAAIRRSRLIPQWVATEPNEQRLRDVALSLQQVGAVATVVPHETDRHLAGSYDLTLERIGPNRLETLKQARTVTGWDLTRVKQALEITPVTLLSACNARESADAALALESAGATVTLMGTDVTGLSSRYVAGSPRQLIPDAPVPDPEALADQAFQAWTEQDAALAETLWQQAANLGSSRAMVNLGRNRLEEGDHEGATSWLSLANEAGNADGAYWLGRMAFERGDEQEAERWRWRAADLGDAPTLLWLARREPDPNPGEPFNVGLMLRAANAGSHIARGLLCTRALDREDYEECVQWGESSLELQDQEEDSAQLARLHTVIGSACMSLDRLEDALTHFEAAFSLAPDELQMTRSDIEPLIQALEFRQHATASTQEREPSDLLDYLRRPPRTPSTFGLPQGPLTSNFSQAPVNDGSPGCRKCRSTPEPGAKFCVNCGESLV